MLRECEHLLPCERPGSVQDSRDCGLRDSDFLLERLLALRMGSSGKLFTRAMYLESPVGRDFLWMTRARLPVFTAIVHFPFPCLCGAGFPCGGTFVAMAGFSSRRARGALHRVDSPTAAWAGGRPVGRWQQPGRQSPPARPHPPPGASNPPPRPPCQER